MKRKHSVQLLPLLLLGGLLVWFATREQKAPGKAGTIAPAPSSGFSDVLHGRSARIVYSRPVSLRQEVSRVLDACTTAAKAGKVTLRGMRPWTDAKPGEPVEVSWSGKSLGGSIDSRLDEGEVRHIGVELSGGLGRMTLSLREDNLLLAHTYFYGEETCLTWSNTPEDTGTIAVEELAYWQTICAPPGTKYPEKGEKLEIAANAGTTTPFVPSPGDPNSPVAPLESLPGAPAVLYMDFDGESIKHPAWNNGKTINAAPHPNYTNATWVNNVWRRVGEDYAPFAINVTTKRSVYDAAPANKRMMVVVTPSRAWLTSYTTVGGMAFLNVFPFGIPCFVFNLDEYSCAETVSHEAGHTLGLSHDGRRYENQALNDDYYGGHGSGQTSWAPIMGAAFSDESPSPYQLDNVTQWSQGEYANAGNQENDLALIASALNAFGYRQDDAGDEPASAAELTASGNTVSASGLIGRNNDTDMYRFVAGTGGVSFQVNPLNVGSSFDNTMGANLALKLALYDVNGNLLQQENPAGALGASLSRNVSAGTYYLAITGAGRGTVDTGFSKYGSLGKYTLTGTINGGTIPSQIDDTSPPAVVIDSPASGNVADAQITMSGTVSDNVGVTQVRVRINGGAWQNASGTGNWTYTANAVPGANQLDAQATDAKGNQSPIESRTVIYGSTSAKMVVETASGTIRILASGTGTLTFGSRATGLSQSKPIRIRNTGTNPLTGITLSLGGANPGDFVVGAVAQNILAAGTNQTVSISFAPTTEGMKSATLRIQSNDPTKQPYSIGLSGMGAPKPETQYLWMNLAGMPGGSGSADGVGAGARFNYPCGIVIGAGGVMFIVDSLNCAIRKIMSSGAVETIAGSPGFPGKTDGIGADARFFYPRAMVMDGSGNLYVADMWNHAIRKISPSGVVTTFVGTMGIQGMADGLGENSSFSYPEAIAIDRSGIMYVADTSNHTIRKVTPAGMVTTLAGRAGVRGGADGFGGDASFLFPQGLAVDADGTLYVSDTYNHTIRKITSAGVVSTLAGRSGMSGSVNGQGDFARFYYPAGLTLDDVGNIIVADGNNRAIRKVTPLGFVTSVAGGPSKIGSGDGPVEDAQFYRPSHLVYDTEGNLFVSDEGGNTIRKISTIGVASTVAGMPANWGRVDGSNDQARFWVPRGIVVDGDGVLVADAENGAIRRVTADGIVSTFVESGIIRPLGVASYIDGNVFVADEFSTVLKVSHQGDVSTLAGNQQEWGYLNGTGADARFGALQGLTVDKDGNVYVCDRGANSIRKVSQTGVVSTLAGSSGEAGAIDGVGSAARFNCPYGIAAGKDGNIYVADELNHAIRRVSVTGEVSTIAGNLEGGGNLDGPAVSARFNRPKGIAIDENGNLYIADSYNNTIRKVSLSGSVTTLGGKSGQGSGVDGIGTASRFSEPSGVAVTSGGILFIADTGNNRIVKGTPLAAGAVQPPLVIWRTDKLGTASNSGLAADSADPDSDGQINLLEFALNGNPNQSDLNIQPRLTHHGAQMSFTYTRRTDALQQGLSFLVEWSTDLSAESWTTIGASERILSDDGTTQDIEVTAPATGTRMFFRLRVSNDND